MARRQVTIAWLLAGASTLVAFVGFPLAALEGEVFTAMIALPLTAYGIVGALIASGAPQNRIWKFYSTVGVMGPLATLGEVYAKWGRLPGREWVAWATSFSFPAVFGSLLVFIPLLFPDGRLPSRRWRWLAAAGGAQMILATAAFVVGPGSLDCCSDIDNPMGVEALRGFTNAYLDWGFLMLAVTALVAFSSLVFRFRAAGVVERLQLKWFLFGVGLLVVASFGGGVAGLLGLEGNFGPYLIFPVAILSLPVATGIAITRYRLYEIDVVINKTLVYGSLTAVLATGYFGAIVVLQTLFRPFTQGSDLAIAGSTLTVAALFRPLRTRVQALVDRRFYRRKYDAAKTLDAFSASLRQEVDLESLGSELRKVVEDAMQPRGVVVWIRAGLERQTS